MINSIYQLRQYPSILFVLFLLQGAVEPGEQSAEESAVLRGPVLEDLPVARKPDVPGLGEGLCTKRS